MDENKLIISNSLSDYWTREIEQSKASSYRPSLPKVFDVEAFREELMRERKGQRKVLINFVCFLTIASFYLLAGLIIVQTFHRARGEYGFEVIDASALTVFAVSVFGQVVGLMYIMTKSLWNGQEFGMFANIKDK